MKEPQVVTTGKRRWVDAHWERGNSYFRMGGTGGRGAWTKTGQSFPPFCCRVALTPNPRSPLKSEPRSTLNVNLRLNPTDLLLEICRSTSFGMGAIAAYH